MERQCPNQRQGERPGLSQMAEDREQQQYQSHHQLTPLVPPAPGPVRLCITKQRTTAARLSRKPPAAQRLKRALKRLLGVSCRTVKAQPGTAGYQVDTGFLDSRLLLQRAFNGSHTTAAFHSLNIQQHHLVAGYGIAPG